jgi:hypothetical protein
LKEHNPKATIITTPWDLIDGALILKNMEAGKSLEEELMEEVKAHRDEDRLHEHEHHHHHHHDHDDHDEDEHEHHHHHHDDDDDDEDEHEHHHHHHDDDDDDDEHEHHHHDHDHEHEHEHHHDHGPDCTCGCHDHDHDHEHHHHHHADEVFDSVGFETPKSFTEDEINAFLDALSDEEKYGIVLRSKGMVPAKDGGFIYFDYVPEEKNVRSGAPDVTGKIVVIGSKIKEYALKQLLGL